MCATNVLPFIVPCCPRVLGAGVPFFSRSERQNLFAFEVEGKSFTVVDLFACPLLICPRSASNLVALLPRSALHESKWSSPISRSICAFLKVGCSRGRGHRNILAAVSFGIWNISMRNADKFDLSAATSLRFGFKLFGCTPESDRSSGQDKIFENQCSDCVPWAQTEGASDSAPRRSLDAGATLHPRRRTTAQLAHELRATRPRQSAC